MSLNGRLTYSLQHLGSGIWLAQLIHDGSFSTWDLIVIVVVVGDVICICIYTCLKVISSRNLQGKENG